jgi:hypothetical protein
MGYKNNARPNDLDLLITDVMCDLDDLCYDITVLSDYNDEVFNLLKSIDFIRTSMKQVRNMADNKENYRGTGKSKAYCQAQVGAMIEQWKKDFPNTPYPAALDTWVDNIADDKDVVVARTRKNAKKTKVDIKKIEKSLGAKSKGKIKAGSGYFSALETAANRPTKKKIVHMCCSECIADAEWVKKNQFVRDQYFCQFHAEKENGFGKTDLWQKL